MTDPQPQSTPETAQDHTGSDHATHGANTNLTPDVVGGPANPQDRAATDAITDQHAHDGGNHPG
ncbi:hypothetical protein [Deinococcus sp. JMULE3]|uniref:hypothetical protein n=1 Tax=Deinococcus sp. JMULE3 TaxID=2518341 RepID=UPI0015774DFC|nr:hypothetical protein [Deinococcus sp. JMULE3]NTY00299.1 hypothetical protein [Deinococcus sp. JMULE3]